MKVCKEEAKKLLEEVGQDHLVIATKYTDVQGIEELEELGIRYFGENRVQDFLKKYEVYQGKGKFHFIGTLQKNKVKSIIDKVELIHSVDSIGLLDEIDKQAYKINRVMNILIEVNISKEESKHGIFEEQVSDLLDYASKKKNLKVLGFMMMAPNIEAEDTRIYFKRMKDLLSHYQKTYPNLIHLSMGMSNDYKIALEEGSTLVRVGSKLFI